MTPAQHLCVTQPKTSRVLGTWKRVRHRRPQRKACCKDRTPLCRNVCSHGCWQISLESLAIAVSLAKLKASDIFQVGCGCSFSPNRCSDVFWGFFFPASSPLAPAWMLSHCDCLISHRCRCLCYITRLSDSLGDKLLPKKHSRCELRCTDAMGEPEEFRGD